MLLFFIENQNDSFKISPCQSVAFHNIHIGGTVVSKY